MNHFQYEAKDNLNMSALSIGIVFKKGGSYIFILGMTYFCVIISMQLCMITISAYQEEQYHNELSKLNYHERILHRSYIQENRFQIYKIGYMFGNILFMKNIEVVALMHPSLPFGGLLFTTIIMIILAATIQYTAITSVWPFFVLTSIVGALDGSMFTSFLFNAITETDLPCCMGMHFREMELVVNLLLIAQNTGKFFGQVFTFYVISNTNPSLLYN